MKEEKISKRVCAIEVMRWVEEARKVSLLSIILFFVIVAGLLISFKIGIVLFGISLGIMSYFTYKANSFRLYLREKYGV